MREIKFRGKRKDTGEWVYGSYVYFNNPELEDFYQIIVNNGHAFDIDPETVGQFTGLKDKNGVEIYEGDKIDHYAFNGYVIFEDGMFSIISNSKKQFGGYRQPMVYHNSTDMEVIHEERSKK